MVALIRTRGAASEIATLFAATALPGLDWRESIWPGEQVPVVSRAADRRLLTTMAWGLPQKLFRARLATAQRASFYSRDLVTGGSRLCDPAELQRCLIIVEAWAMPAGDPRRRTRQWSGLWDEPLVAWAGLCTRDHQHCAGLVQRSLNGDDAAPRLLTRTQASDWLGGAGQLTLGAGHPPEAFYREDIGERWSSGRPEDDRISLFAA